MDDVDERALLNAGPLSQALADYIALLSSRVATPHATVPEVKSYPDAVYFNYHALGLSLLFTPVDAYKPRTGLDLGQLDTDRLVLNGIDVYNVPGSRAGATSSRTAKLAYSTYPLNPISLQIVTGLKDGEGHPVVRPASVAVRPDTTGKEFVQALGEPDRKGGGAGPSSGSIGIWCEWSCDGVMVEFGGDEASGPQAWDRAKDAVWKVITLFPARHE